MKIGSSAPFSEFDCYKVFHKGMSRWQVCLKHRETGARSTILFSKFLMSVSLGRRLRPEEEVDHVNGDKSDDRLENLEVVTKSENLKRQAAIRRDKSLVHLECPSCSQTFSRPIHRTHLRRGGDRTFCSRSCSAAFNSPKRKLSHAA